MSEDNQLPYDTPVDTDWTPPVTVGGTWCRINKKGIYEFWPVPGSVPRQVFTEVLTSSMQLTPGIVIQSRSSLL